MSDKRRAILPRMRCDDDVGAEIARLRARVEKLERQHLVVVPSDKRWHSEMKEAKP
jgi:hypothetical protein